MKPLIEFVDDSIKEFGIKPYLLTPLDKTNAYLITPNQLQTLIIQTLKSYDEYIKLIHKSFPEI